MNKNNTQINHLKQIIQKKVAPLINNDFVLLDVPNHRNIGDSLIWAGERAFFEDLNSQLIAQYNRNTFKNSQIPSRNTIILLHGGGNFGDIYQTSQDFRKKIIQDFPNNKIIILPQTVHYRSEEKLKNDFSIFSRHENLFICVRDKKSYQTVKDNFPENKILLVPDMAFYLNFDKHINQNSTGKTLFFKRTDAEAPNKNFDKYISEKSYDITDWPTYNSKSKNMNTLSNYIEALDGKLTNALKHMPFSSLFINGAYGFKSKNGMENLITTGINFLNQYDKIYTTRLHGLILSILLNKEVLILDNSYGKSTTFFDTWLKDFENVTLLP